MKRLLTVLLLLLAATPASAQSRADSAQSYVARGAAWFEKGEVERAISDYNLAIAFDPHSATAWLNRAIARSYKGDHEGALEDYTRTLALIRGNTPPGSIGETSFSGGAISRRR